LKKLLLLALVTPALVLAIYDAKSFDLNRWDVSFYNNGIWTRSSDSLPGVPGNYVFGAGAWLGAILGSDTVVTFTFNPNSGGTEMGPTSARYWREGYADSLDRVYKYPGDWPPSPSRFPGSPQQHMSEMDLWFCCTDSDPSLQSGSSRPIGIDLHGTICGFDDPNAWDFFFIRYEVVNMNPDTIGGLYVGPVTDADIGDGSDDLTGLILDGTYVVRSETINVTNTGFVYDGDNYEAPGAQWDSSGAPGTVAIMLLQSPHDLGLTAFKQFTIDIDPNTDPDRYLTLAGYDYRTRAYVPYDSESWVPADKRVLFSTGPYDLAPDSTATYWYAVIGSPFGAAGQPPRERDTSDLAERCKWARYYFGLFAGIAESRPSSLAPRHASSATIIRGVLFLPPSLLSPPSSLFSLDGRKVLNLRPGANDVSALSPGVYFVRSVPSAVAKVVIAH
jgi:hypothetical protein